MIAVGGAAGGIDKLLNARAQASGDDVASAAHVDVKLHRAVVARRRGDDGGQVDDDVGFICVEELQDGGLVADIQALRFDARIGGKIGVDITDVGGDDARDAVGVFRGVHQCPQK